MRPFRLKSWFQTFVVGMTFTVVYMYTFFTYPQHRATLNLTSAILVIGLMALGVVVRLRRRR
jgi:hypothetical protein